MRFFSVLSLSLALFLAVLVPASADPVQLLPDDPASVVSVSATADVKAGSTDLKYAPYIGSGWFTGTVSGLGEVYLYVPVSSRGVWGTTADGYLCNVDLLFPVFCSRHPALSILLTLLLSLFLVIVLFLLQVIMTGAIFG